MVHFCDVHMFFVEEIIEAVSSIAKTWPKNKDLVDIWIKCLVNSLQGYDRPVSITAAITRPLLPFTGIYNM